MSKKNIEWLHGELPKLVVKGIVDCDTANRILNHYGDISKNSGNIFYILFGILGSLLIGTGVISLFAHNWDQFHPFVKIGLAFIPLLCGQFIAGYTLFKKSESRAWSESSSIFLTLSIATVIALIGQVYHVPGNLADFMIVWMLLTIPVIFLFNSISTTSIYSLCLLTWTFAMADDHRVMNLFWLLLLPIIILFIKFFFNKGPSISTRLLGLMIAFLLPITLFAVLQYSISDDAIMLAYISLFSLFYCFGNLWSNNDNQFCLYSFSYVGLVGVTVLSMMFTFSGIWSKLNKLSLSNPAVSILLLSSVACYILCIRRKIYSVLIIAASPLIFTFCQVMVFSDNSLGFISAIIFNIYLLIVGVTSIIYGVKNSIISTVNFGMLTLSSLLILRFVDRDFNFVLRGIIFISIGCGFMFTNYIMVRRKKHRQNIVLSEVR